LEVKSPAVVSGGLATWYSIALGCIKVICMSVLWTHLKRN